MKRHPTMRWDSSTPALYLIDQRILPRVVRDVRCINAAQTARAIQSMVVRGAPAIGCAAAFGIALEAARTKGFGDAAPRNAFTKAFQVLAASRPTAVNLFWALERMQRAVDAHRGEGAQAGTTLARTLERLACTIHAQPPHQRIPLVQRLIAPVLFFAVSLAPAPDVQAASFDCARARTKLNRMICADVELSALDSRVWDAFGARINGISVAQYTHVRERHFTWRRQRGWYDRTVDAIKDDYQRHLAWLTHPLLALEGRYEMDDGYAVQIEIDTDAPQKISVAGSVLTTGLVRHAFSWVPPASGEPLNHIVRDTDSAEARPTLLLTRRTSGQHAASFSPAFIGAPLGPVQDCRIDLGFGNDELTLTTQGACGARLDGTYVKRASQSATWGRQ